ncbi:hypothetical protein EW145_g7649 [Phellinidium pouzarii]|uniref:Uncharacterized protein n=1 Tax=Phellinidium pouzarii TaxID=167371 RepID=A0A4S4KKT1_9AGAM|nr:hypothetical protein EW145_g7649 [Phellinidium pouzarii]
MSLRNENHKKCTPVSDKIAICKLDLIGIGIIIFTVFFLLCCLEHIVKFFRKTLCAGARRERVEAPSPTQSDAPLINHCHFSSSSSTPSPELGNPGIIPLYRCQERSASESAVPLTSHSSSSNSISLPQMRSLSSFVSIQIPRLILARGSGASRPALRSPITVQDISVLPGDLDFGSPQRASTPPPREK